MEYRLRIYTLRDDSADEFVRRWAQELVPMRERMGFEVPMAWRVEQPKQLVWVVGWPGPGSYDEAESRYHDSAERQAVTWDTADFVNSYDIRAIEPLAWRQ